MTFTDLINKTTHNQALFLPAPSRESIPILTADAERYELYTQLVALHYTGFLALHGPPPAGVVCQRVNIEIPGGLRRPTYLARLDAITSHTAVVWFHAFEAGLDSWSEAEITNPITTIPTLEDPQVLDIHIASYADSVINACRRLKRLGRTDALRFIRDHVGEAFSPRFDPDHPAYASRR